MQIFLQPFANCFDCCVLFRQQFPQNEGDDAGHTRGINGIAHRCIPDAPDAMTPKSYTTEVRKNCNRLKVTWSLLSRIIEVRDQLVEEFET